MAKKQIEVVVTLSVPSWMTKADAKREVRSRINEQAGYSNYYFHDDYDITDVKARKVR